MRKRVQGSEFRVKDGKNLAGAFFPEPLNPKP
jgi:hypothetical protein